MADIKLKYLVEDDLLLVAVDTAYLFDSCSIFALIYFFPSHELFDTYRVLNGQGVRGSHPAETCKVPASQPSVPPPAEIPKFCP